MKQHIKSRLFVLFGILLCPFIFFCILTPKPPSTIPILEIDNRSKVIVPESNFTSEWNETIHKYLKLPFDNHYGSHAIVLLAAAMISESGPMLELGMGSTSTPLLHRLAVEQNRSLLSADTDLRWVNYFATRYGNDSSHEMKYVEVNTETGVEWASAHFQHSDLWGIVFIDHRPGPRRKFDLMLYARRSHIVILHDTEQTSLYQYGEGLAFYRYQYRFTRLLTYTDVLSTNNEKFILQIRFLLESIPDYFFPNKTVTQNS